MPYIDDQPKLGTRVPNTESLLMTVASGTDLALVLPKQREVAGLSMLLTAVFFRFQEDPDWVKELGEWADKNIPEVD